MHTQPVLRPLVLVAGFMTLASCSRHVVTGASPATVSTSTSTTTTTSTRVASGGLPASVTPAMLQEGDSIFNHGSCQRCHGMNGTNGRTGPDLTDATWLHIDGSYESIVHIISTGVAAADFKSPTSRFPMRPNGGMPLTDEQLHAVAGYVYSLSHH